VRSTARLHDDGFASARRGITLIESVISLAIVGVVLVAALQTVAASARFRAQRGERELGMAMAEDLMGEILSVSFEEPDGTPVFGREAGEADTDRVSWDDVDDYDGWSASPPVRRDGTPVPGATEWTRSVSVVYVDVVDPNARVAGPTRLKRITVKVAAPRGQILVLTALRERDGLGEYRPAIADKFITHVGVSLEAGGAATIVGGTPVLNVVRAEDAP
jgi:prepilin-type N-terminal cleavage/methylation domain-containing protein